jgi:hypothetical protein
MSINITTIFENPFQYCDRCPDKTTRFEVNTTLHNLGIQSRFWRLLRETSSVYSCKSERIYMGTNSVTKRDASPDNDSISGLYCKEHRTDPLCEVCVYKDSYLIKK